MKLHNYSDIAKRGLGLVALDSVRALREENARLLAINAELLDALKTSVRCNEWFDGIESARKAIAKATS